MLNAPWLVKGNHRKENLVKSKLKAVGHQVWGFLISPQARRFEIPLVVGLFEVVRKALHG